MHNSDTLLGIVKIDDDGRLVIPPEIQEQMGWTEDKRVEVGVNEHGELTLRVVPKW